MNGLRIREATLEDLPAMVQMGSKFFTEAMWEDFASWDDRDASTSLAHFITSESFVTLVVEDHTGTLKGMTAAAILPPWFGGAVKIGTEMFWYVSPECRNGVGLELLKALENSARSKGASRMLMVSVERLRGKVVGRLLRRSGYEATEQSYMRVL